MHRTLEIFAIMPTLALLDIHVQLVEHSIKEKTTQHQPQSLPSFSHYGSLKQGSGKALLTLIIVLKAHKVKKRLPVKNVSIHYTESNWPNLSITVKSSFIGWSYVTLHSFVVALIYILESGGEPTPISIPWTDHWSNKNELTKINVWWQIDLLLWHSLQINVTLQRVY